MTAQSKADHFVWDSSGKASIDGYDLAELAKKFPTPFYLISQGQLRDNYRRLRQAFASVEGLETYYSVKSNFESIVLRTLADEGCGAEISGALDMELAKRAGMPPNKVVFDGPVKPEEDLRAAIEWGVRFINIESMNEARMISRIATEMGKKVKVGLRIDPQLSKPYYDKVISTYKEKFGLPIEQAEAAIVEIAKLPGLDFKCIMTHIGSQIFTPSRYIVTIEKIFNLVGALAKRNIEIEEINMGGGYPAQSMRNLRAGDGALRPHREEDVVDRRLRRGDLGQVPRARKVDGPPPPPRPRAGPLPVRQRADRRRQHQDRQERLGVHRHLDQRRAGEPLLLGVAPRGAG
jgi:diaminopimelate decarboxylase